MPSEAAPETIRAPPRYVAFSITPRADGSTDPMKSCLKISDASVKRLDLESQVRTPREFFKHATGGVRLEETHKHAVGAWRFCAIVRKSSRDDPVAPDVGMDQRPDCTGRTEPMHVFQIADSNQCGPPLTPGALHNDQRRL